MRTVHSVIVGRRIVVLRSDGSVYIGDRPDEGERFARGACLVATSAAGAEALADALREVAAEIRKRGP